MKLEQWVNISKNYGQETADPDKVLKLERIGREAGIRVKFEKGTVAKAEYRIVPDEDLASIYKGVETGYSTFGLVDGTSSVVVADGDTVVTKTCELPAMGGNRYRVEARYTHPNGKKTVKKSQSYLAGARRVFCVPVEMDLHSSVKVTLNEGFAKLAERFWDPSKDLYVDLRRKQPSKSTKIARRSAPVGSSAAIDAFFAELKGHVAPLKKCIPGFVLVWGDQIATKVGVEGSETFNVAVSETKGTNEFNATTQELTLTPGDYFWHGFSPTEDVDKHWLDAVTISALDELGMATAPVSVPREAVTLDGDPDYKYGGYKTARVKLGDAGGALNAVYERGGRFKVEWSFRHAASGAWNWGVSYTKGNVVVIATRSHWEPIAKEDVLASAVHEVGHRMGLVPNGKSPAYLEASAKEDGSLHCADRDCVMLAVGSAPDEFCAECAKILRKSDLSVMSGIYGRNIA